MLRDAGAVLIAKLATGELASGDRWFGGQTKNPWDPTQGSSGSSAGPSSATAAGCVGFGIGTETSGSILSPSARCGLAGPASDVRPHQPLRRDGAVVDAGSPRADLPLRRRLRDRDAGDREARRPRHERVGHPVQLERAARHQDTEGRLHQGVVRRADERRGARHNAAEALDTLRSIGVVDVRSGGRARDDDERQRPRCRIDGVLRRVRARPGA